MTTSEEIIDEPPSGQDPKAVLGKDGLQRRPELRQLVEHGRASGLSDQPGEAVLDRLEAKYRSIAKRHRA
ncbi:MAG TPA: hypothetical protein VKI44_17345 [Acetobacteraceae bacterium]|nr:hypothetical protein [Acetobacteraceae bacterium]